MTPDPLSLSFFLLLFFPVNLDVPEILSREEKGQVSKCTPWRDKFRGFSVIIAPVSLLSAVDVEDCCSSLMPRMSTMRWEVRGGV